MAGPLPLQPAAARPAGSMLDNKFSQRTNEGTDKTGQDKDTVSQRKTSIKPYKQGLDKQGYSGNALHQQEHCQQTQTRDFKQTPSEKFH